MKIHCFPQLAFCLTTFSLLLLRGVLCRVLKQPAGSDDADSDWTTPSEIMNRSYVLP